MQNRLRDSDVWLNQLNVDEAKETPVGAVAPTWMQTPAQIDPHASDADLIRIGCGSIRMRIKTPRTDFQSHEAASRCPRSVRSVPVASQRASGVLRRIYCIRSRPPHYSNTRFTCTLQNVFE